MKKNQGITGADPVIGITARFADREIAHLERVLRSVYREVIEEKAQPYWRRRIEHLRAAPLLLPQQKARLDSLLSRLAG